MDSEAEYREARPSAVIDRRYVVRREIARGGMGVVFEAEHVLTRAPVAIKTLTDEALGWATVRQRLLREARALAVAKHPRVVGVLDAGVCGAHGPFIALEMIDGRTLESFVMARGRLPVATVIAIAAQVSSALAHAHARGVVHRDVKPGNVLVTRESGREVLKLVDFGIARVAGNDDVVDRKLTRGAEVIGTIEYVAPEQIVDGAEPTPATDVYALGVTLYECLAGDVPHAGSLSHIMAALASGASPRPLRALRPDIPEALAAIVERAMARAPDRRFPHAAALAESCLALAGNVEPPLALLDAQHDAPRRRHHVRAPFVTPARICTAAGPRDGRTEDISEGGLLVVMEASCEEGEQVEVRFPLPTSGRVVGVRAVARWARTQRGQRAVGVEFTHLPEEAGADIRRYVSFMCGASGRPPVGEPAVAQ
jgi:serine/threonine-protein kinase